MSKGKGKSNSSNGLISGIKETAVGNETTLQSLIFKPHKLSFILKDNMTIANGLRRAMLSMVPATSLYCDTTDIETDDHIIPVILKIRLQQIPIDQKFKPTKMYNFEFINRSEMSMIITGKEFFDYVKEKPFFNLTTQIAELNPGKFLKIKKLRFATGTGEDCKTFDLTAGIEYEPLDQGKESSLTTIPHMYHLGVYSNGNIEAKAIVKIACEVLIGVLNEILSSLNKDDNKEEYPRKYPKTTVEKEGDLMIYKIANMDHTIGNMIAYHIFEQDKNIQLVTYDVEDTPDLICKVKINHPNHKKLFENSINICIKKFDNIKKSF